jgi:8-oxo-dGTP pyrophosphatase MutT (NUDIX family)
VRLSARLFVVDADDRLLLLDCTDPAEPGTCWWEVPGGGVEPGEDEFVAAIREVAEETGVHVDPSLVGPLTWTQDSTYTWFGGRRTSRCHGYLARVAAVHAFAPPRLTAEEVGTILGTRWWTAAEMHAFAGRFFPSTLPGLFPRLLAGERVDEPFDHWS